jgi:hypothetical protein
MRRWKTESLAAVRRPVEGAGTERSDGRWRLTMPQRTESEPTFSSGADVPMTAEQAALLKRLAHAAYDVEAYHPNLTRSEAERRIAVLEAKLKLLDGPPHTQ